jgi:hypothetical protein
MKEYVHLELVAYFSKLIHTGYYQVCRAAFNIAAGVDVCCGLLPASSNFQLPASRPASCSLTDIAHYLRN